MKEYRIIQRYSPSKCRYEYELQWKSFFGWSSFIFGGTEYHRRAWTKHYKCPVVKEED